jgi:hypothetical protein
MNDNQKKDDPPLPHGWTKGFSKSQNRAYYFCKTTQHTQWHFPTATEAADPLKAKQRLLDAQEAAKASTSSTSSKRKVAPPALSLGEIPFQPISTTKKRPRIQDNTVQSASNNASSDSTCVAIIVPYRDIHPSQNRSKHLEKFIPHMHSFLTKQVQKGTCSDYHIYIVEQSDDGRKFNRGKLLNIGFDLARKNKCRLNAQVHHDVFIFHDVDLLPGSGLERSYTQFPNVPIHIARVWERYSNNPKYFGGIVSFSSSDMKRINGYPNTFWGWGGEDDEMQKRCERLGIKWDSPRSGTIIDLEDMSLSEKLNMLREHKEWKCMVKWEALEEHESTWRTNGLADLNYSILKKEDLDEGKSITGGRILGDHRSRATKVTVDVKLNGNHWTNEKCGADYTWDA